MRKSKNISRNDTMKAVTLMKVRIFTNIERILGATQRFSYTKVGGKDKEGDRGSMEGSKGGRTEGSVRSKAMRIEERMLSSPKLLSSKEEEE